MIPAKEEILAHLSDEHYRPSKLKDLARRLGVGGEEYRAFRKVMRDLEEAGEVRRIHSQRYAPSEAIQRAWGCLRIHPRGFGLVCRTGVATDLFVPAGDLSGAVDGDWVEVEVTGAGGGRRSRPKGRIAKVRAAGVRRVPGIFRRRGRHGAVATAGALVPLDEAPAAHPQEGDLVVVEMEAAAGRSHRGRLSRVIGDPEDPRNDLDTSTVAHGIPMEEDPRAEVAVRALVAEAGSDRRREL